MIHARALTHTHKKHIKYIRTQTCSHTRIKHTRTHTHSHTHTLTHTHTHICTHAHAHTHIPNNSTQVCKAGGTQRKLWLTRHGQSLFNTGDRLGGDSSISPAGERYSNMLPAALLSRLPPVCVCVFVCVCVCVRVRVCVCVCVNVRE